MQKTSRTKQLAFNLIPFIVTLLAILLVLEVLFRSVIPIQEPLLKHHVHLIYGLNPNTVYQEYHDDTRRMNVMDINALGWYGDLSEYETAKSKPKRILAIGDSFLVQPTIGAYDNMFTERTENQDIDAITMGVGSYAFDNEYKLLEQEYEIYDPDLILIATCVNDLMDTTRDNIFSIENDALVDNTPIHFSRLKKLIFHCMSIVKTCKFLIDKLGQVKGGSLLNALAKLTGTADKDLDTSLDYIMYALPRELFNGDLHHPTIEAALTKTDLILQRFKAFEEKHGTKVVFFLIPLRESISKRKLTEFKRQHAIRSPQFDIDRPYHLIRSLLEKNSLSYVDTLEAFRTDDDDNSFYFEQDGHWNEAGHTKAYELLRDYLMALGFTATGTKD